MATHLVVKHKLNKKDYQLKFPEAKVVSDTFREWQKNRMTKLYKSIDVDYRKIAGSRSFDFVSNQKLRLLLQRDYQYAKKCLQSKLWKPAIILFGSLIEAILRESTKTNTFETALDKALNDKIISEIEFHKLHVVRDSRNYVHLHKELSEGETKIINDYWAKTLSDICESLIKKFKGGKLL
ncbi:MAG: hypothetical protein UR68_C0028G0042 [Candidatus Roizmanbacteria bacterium GW2011_GWA2_35_19]|uniref:DUF4145 domain-containing protein n=2 Tax=Candidatus Roizmaniibacteriota TaxID=1752723 RepID=A0A0G0E8S1_9BACT|nr:MAG: hypothetical protein UR63_C0010G0038 [Candidatus Roizmanbacteria bacterium GW2011_GWC2_35_12]KKP71725.1 MAG: hypothetical protein UR68_C0028G0042 [Candidatus Roizmanbacteria bacterium GW2011_GWA2_35_19]